MNVAVARVGVVGCDLAFVAGVAVLLNLRALQLRREPRRGQSSRSDRDFGYGSSASNCFDLYFESPLAEKAGNILRYGFRVREIRRYAVRRTSAPCRSAACSAFGNRQGFRFALTLRLRLGGGKAANIRLRAQRRGGYEQDRRTVFMEYEERLRSRLRSG